MDPMWVDGGEDEVVNKTGEVFPGLIASRNVGYRNIRIAKNGPHFWFNVTVR